MKKPSTETNEKEDPRKDIEEVTGPVGKTPANRIVKIMKNKGGKNPKTNELIIQYRINIPKEFAEGIKLNEHDFEALFESINEGDIRNPNYVVTAKIRRKDGIK